MAGIEGVHRRKKRYPTRRDPKAPLRAELVVDALQMAICGATVARTARSCTAIMAQYTSWAFGRRLRAAGILGSTGSIGDASNNAMAERRPEPAS